MSNKYCRLVTFVVDICPLALREVLREQAKSDTRHQPFTTFTTYMLARQHDVKRLRGIDKHQFTEIYNSATVDETKWDISIVCALLKGLFGGSLLPTSKQAIDTIRRIRNDLQHSPNVNTLTDSDFDTKWAELEDATLDLARLSTDISFVTDVQTLIEDALVKNMPGLADTMVTWCTQELCRKIEKIDDIAEDAATNRSILERASEKRINTATGSASKRIRTVDTILRRLERNFHNAMNKELHGEFKPSASIDDVKDALRSKKHVVLVGHGNSSYVPTAFAAIRDIPECDKRRCALITEPDDWTHIDPEDTDLVFFQHPFGVCNFDEEKSFQMLKVFDKVIEDKKQDDTMYIVVVSRKDILDEALQLVHGEHELFEDVVELYKPTSEDDPDDLTDEFSESKRIQNEVMRNLSVLNTMRLQQNRNVLIKESVITDVHQKLRKHKSLVLLGPKSVTTPCVMTIASKFYENSSLVLTCPGDLRFHRLDHVSLLVIEQFGGEQKSLNKHKVDQWFERFDTVQSVVSKTGLRVILTCESTKMRQLQKGFNNHALIANTHTVHVRDVHSRDEENALRIKTEPVDSDYGDPGVSTGATQTVSKHKTPSSYTATPESTMDSSDRQHTAAFSHDINVKLESDKSTCAISDMTLLSEDRLAVVDYANNSIKLINIDTNTVIRQLQASDIPKCITKINRDLVAATFEYTDKVQFISVPVSGEMVMDRMIYVGLWCYGIVYTNDRLIVSFPSPKPHIKIFDMSGQSLRCITKDNVGKDLFSEPLNLAVNAEGNLIYVTDWFRSSVTCLTMEGVVLSVVGDKDKLSSISGVTVTGDGVLYVCNPDSVYKVNIESGTITTLIDKITDLNFYRATGLTFCNKNKKLYIGGDNKNTIKVYNVD